MTTEQGIDATPIDSELAEILTRAAGLPPEAIAEAGERRLLDLGLDSLAAMELQASLKDRYQVQIPDEALEMSIPEITRYVAARLGTAG